MTKKIESWTSDIIRGQECIVDEFGLGRVMDFGHEFGSGGQDYVAVHFYSDPTRQQFRRFVPEAVLLLDPFHKRNPWLAKTPIKKREPVNKGKTPRVPNYNPSPVQSRPGLMGNGKPGVRREWNMPKVY